MLLRISSLLVSMIELFNPPPLESMSFLQKCGQILRLTAALVLGCILFALLGTLVLALLGAWEFFLCLSVNWLCAYLTIQISKFEVRAFSSSVFPV